MKFMLPRATVLKDNQHLDGQSSSSPLNPSSSPNPTKQKTPRRPKSTVSKENAPPQDSNQTVAEMDCTASPSSSDLKKPMKLKSPLPPRPPLKRKLNVESGGSEKGVYADTGVKVIVRVRPLNKDEEEEEMVVQKISDDSLSLAGHKFTFDSIADSDSSQIRIFDLVGAPLVENCIAGFNSSVFAYGQTGSGKTYTIWGPANYLMEDTLSNNEQGLTPRVFQHLFSRIGEEQTKHVHKQLLYRCRCSFLEIYNEQVTDLLDPSQKNLQIREDVKAGVYVENLTENCVSSKKDVMQLIIKGLSNRRTGSTSVNAESSRSHSVFTCVVESRCKSISDGLSCLKTSRINLVDLAGSERQKLTGAAGDRLKEAGNINRSLSQLGNLINILAEVSQTGKQRHIPYRDSKLTFLLQESLGGNAKLAMICGISPAERCKNETLSTLRFAQRAKAVKNKAIVNEEMQDDVNVLREVIRQLKDELVRMKSNGNQTDQDGNNMKVWNARRSLNLLKFSLNRPLTLPRVEEDSDVEMEIVDQDDHSAESKDGGGMDEIQPGETLGADDHAHEDDTDVSMEEASENEIVGACKQVDILESATSTHNLHNYDGTESIPSASLKCSADNTSSADFTLVTDNVSPVLKSPTPSISPTVNSSCRKSLRTSSEATASHKGLVEKSLEPVIPGLPLAKPLTGMCASFSSQRSRSRFKKPTEHLAASLQSGLDILDSHRHGVSLRKSTFRFSYRPTDTKALVPVPKVDMGIQTLLPDDEPVHNDTTVFLCGKCKTIEYKADNVDEADGLNLQLVPVDGLQSCDKLKNHVPKSFEKVLAGAIRREMALEELCAKQNSEIMHLNRMVQQYKHERECNAIISQMREDKIFRLENLMDGLLNTEEFMEDEFLSLTHEHKLIKEKYENHPEVLRAKIELKRVQADLDKYRNFVDLGERDVLLEEIRDLRNQLQLYVDSSPKVARRRSPFLQLAHSCQPCLAPTYSAVLEANEDNAEQRFQQERLQWTEAESEWINLVEELKSELESSRALAEKHKHDLDSEKKCSDELSEAMQLAMEGHARMLEQYADLEEKHMQLLERHRKIQDGIEDVKKAATKASVRGTESKFINALAAEISALKVERERERRFFIDENRSLQAQLRDTAEAVEAAGELLMRLKEAEGAIAAAEKRAIEAEQEAYIAYKQLDELKSKHVEEINALNQLIPEEPHISRSAMPLYVDSDGATSPVAAETQQNIPDQNWLGEFEPYRNSAEDDFSKSGEDPTSWFSGYDRCNI